MSDCYSPIGNTGNNLCKLQQAEFKRFMFTVKTKKDGSKNTIPLADAPLIATWQAKFDIYGFSTNILEKIVPTPVIYGVAIEQADPETFEENGYFEQLAEGDYSINFTAYNLIPEVIKNLKTLQDSNIAVWPIDNDNRIWGEVNGTNFDPIDIQNILVPNFTPKTRSAPSSVMPVFRLSDPKQMNNISSVTLSDGDVLDDNDFYGLLDGTVEISDQTVDGCVLDIALTRGWGGGPITGVDAADVKFYDQAAPTVPINITGTFDEAPDGTYTLDQTSIFTLTNTYDVKISHSGFDIAVGTFTV